MRVEYFHSSGCLVNWVKVPNRTSTTLMAKIKETSKMDRNFSGIKRLQNSRAKSSRIWHFAVNHRYNFVDTTTGTHIQKHWKTLEINKMAKQKISRNHTKTDSYPSELMWRHLQERWPVCINFDGHKRFLATKINLVPK